MNKIVLGNVAHAAAILALACPVPAISASRVPTPAADAMHPTLVPAPVVSTVRLYVLNCGQLVFNDPEYYNLTRKEVADTNMPVTCYVVVHPKGVLLFDTGLEDTLVGRPIWENIVQGYGQLKVNTLRSQLADIGIRPEDVTYLALSHSHFDHAGNANDFPKSIWLTPKAEYEFMFNSPVIANDYDDYSKLKDAKRIVYEDDHDVFGDGSVILEQTPGHTPGHQSLYVKLARTGGVVVAGDLYHYPEEKTLNRMPASEETAGTPQSRKKIDVLIAKTHSQLWIGHSTRFYRDVRKSPAFYD